MTQELRCRSDWYNNRCEVCIVGGGACGLLLAADLIRRGISVILVEVSETDQTGPYHVESEHGHRGVMEGWATGLGGTTSRWGGQLWAWTSAELAEFAPELAAEVSDSKLAVLHHRVRGLLKIRDPHLGRAANAPPGAMYHERLSTWLSWRKRNFGRTMKRYLNSPLCRIVRGVATELCLEGQRVVGVSVDDGGKGFRVEANQVVLAAGTIGNSALLAPHSALSDKVKPGDNFIDHVSTRVAELEFLDLDTFQKNFGAYYNRGVLVSRKWVANRDWVVEKGAQECFAHFEIELPEGDSLSLLREILRGRQGAKKGRNVRRLGNLIWPLLRDHAWPAAIQAVSRMRYLPASARIFLRVDVGQVVGPSSLAFDDVGPEGTGAIKRGRLTWSVHENEERTAQLFVDELLSDEAFILASGSQQIRRTRTLFSDTFHMMGGTPLSEDAEKGVVDLNLKVHWASNLFVTGPSVFPAGGVGNPTSLAMVLTLRLADHLSEACGHVE